METIDVKNWRAGKWGPGRMVELGRWNLLEMSFQTTNNNLFRFCQWCNVCILSFLAIHPSSHPNVHRKCTRAFVHTSYFSSGCLNSSKSLRLSPKPTEEPVCNICNLNFLASTPVAPVVEGGKVMCMTVQWPWAFCFPLVGPVWCLSLGSFCFMMKTTKSDKSLSSRPQRQRIESRGSDVMYSHVAVDGTGTVMQSEPVRRNK